MAMTFRGIDWGSGPSQTVAFYVNPRTGERVDLSQEQINEMTQKHEEFHNRYQEMRNRLLRRRRLLVDYKVGTTSGTEKVRWLRAQRDLQLGKPAYLVMNGKPI